MSDFQSTISFVLAAGASLLAVVAFAVGCSGSPSEYDHDAGGGDGDTDSDTDVDTDGDTDTDGPECELNSTFCDTDSCEYRADGIFVVWWDAAAEYFSQTVTTLNELNAIRELCLDEFEMSDPPNPLDGYCYNVYIHSAGDLFPDGWALGQGTDTNGYPYLTLPAGYHLDEHALSHEGFHIFQYNSTSPGFAYSGDSAWYIEATANWFDDYRYPEEDDLSLREVPAAVTINPQVQLWATWENQPGDPPGNWSRYNHQYGIWLFLGYLTTDLGIDPYDLAHAFYAGLDLSPQQHLDDLLAAASLDLREVYADWAAKTAVYDYALHRELFLEREEYWAAEAGEDDHRVVADFASGGSGGAFTVPAELAPASYGYNVYRVSNSGAASYTITFAGEATGTDGATAEFRVRAVRYDDDDPTSPIYSGMVLADGLGGTLDVTTAANEELLYVVVAATPDNFAGSQQFGYQIDIQLN